MAAGRTIWRCCSWHPSIRTLGSRGCPLTPRCALFDRLSDPRSKLFLLSSPDLTVTCVNQVVIGIKSSQRRMR